MKMVMASLSFERGRFGYSVHAEEDKIFVLQREYDEHTGSVINIVGAFECGTTISEVKKLFDFFEQGGLSVVKHNDSTSYDPNVTATVILDDGEIMLNETSNSVSLIHGELFVQFGLDEEPNVLADAHDEEQVEKAAGDEEYAWYAGF